MGTEKVISDFSHTAGYLYFATDSGKIYLDTTTPNERITVGGSGSAIYYMTKEIATSPDDSESLCTVLYSELDENTLNVIKVKPVKGDLLINNDGKFLKVLDANDNTKELVCKIIAVSGVGGGGSSTNMTRITVANSEGELIRYYSKDTKSAILKFEVAQMAGLSQADNKINKITYSVGDQIVLEDNSFQEFGQKEIDIAPYWRLMSETTATAFSIKVTDLYGAVATLTYSINAISLSIRPYDTTYDKSIFYYFNDVEKEEEGYFQYNVKVSGSINLDDRKIVCDIYNKDNIFTGASISKESRNNVSSNLMEITPLKGMSHGVYYLHFYLTGKTRDINQTDISSSELIIQVINYRSDQNSLLLAINQSTTTAMQYEEYSVEYMIGAHKDDVNNKYTLDWLIDKNSVDTPSVSPNVLQEFIRYFSEVGNYALSVIVLNGAEGQQEKNLKNVTVVEYSGNMPVIDTKDAALQLYLSATNRNNNDIRRDQWKYKDIYAEFENVLWNSQCGWQNDPKNQTSFLRLANGAKMTLKNWRPFDIDLAQDNNLKGYTIELDFRISNVVDFQKTLISCLKYNEDKTVIYSGFNITGQESTMNTVGFTSTGNTFKDGTSEADQTYNNQLQGLMAKFATDERFHLTWTIENTKVVQANNKKAKPLITTYINGIPVGMTYYETTDQIHAPGAELICDSSYATIDIYNIRAYSRILTGIEVINNYIATCGSNELKISKFESNNLVDENGNLNINEGHYEIEKLLTIPYLKLTGGIALDNDKKNPNVNKWDLIEQLDEKLQPVRRLPQTKNDLRLMSCIYVDPNDSTNNFEEPIGIVRRNDDGTVSEIFSDDTLPTKEELVNKKWTTKSGCRVYGQGTSSMEYPVKNLRIKFKNHEYVAYENAYPVDLVCCKADYMESSGSHNTGTANLVDNLMATKGLESPAQTFQKTHRDYSDGKDLVTNILGHPIIIFWRPSENDDYEFIGKYNLNLDKATPEPFGFLNYPEEKPEKINEDTFGWAINETTDEIVNAIHCYEVLNNSDPLVTFDSIPGVEGETAEERFRNSFFNKRLNEDKELVPGWALAFESRQPEQPKPVDGEIDVDIEPFFRLCKWLNSTKNNPVEFKKHYQEYLDKDFTVFYYVVTHLLLMMDSRAKNMMLATWDNKIWYPIFYDMDTALGLNNYGYNKYSFDTEDTDTGVYNGFGSILWNNVRLALQTEIKDMYESLSGLNYNNLIHNYGTKQADAWNEIIYNLDAQYKYVRPLAEGYYGDGAWVGPYTKDYLYAAQGSRSMHRRWWLANRLNYFNGKYLSSAFKTDKFTMRLYTPSVQTEVVYRTLGRLSENDFIAAKEDGTVYKKDTVTDLYIAAENWEANIEYYEKVVLTDDQKERIRKSLEAIPASHDYTMTPFQNSYMAIAYGGDNGETVGPELAQANTPHTIEAPAGTVFNDTETYIYGGSLLQDLGDLSNKYLGKFEITNSVARLTKLILGNPHNDYYNPNFSALQIGNNLPYLTELNVMNCIGLRSIDISQCNQITKVKATGSNLANIVLPENSLLNELRLPKTMSILKLQGQNMLTNNQFSIGTHTYDVETNTISYNPDFSNLISLQISKTPNIDSYPYAMKAENLQSFYLPDINWKLEEEESVTISNDWVVSIEVLERLKTKYPAGDARTLQEALVGNIEIDIADIKIKAIDIYNKYKEIFPKVTFTYGNKINNLDNINAGNFVPAYRIGFASQNADTLTWSTYVSAGENMADLSSYKLPPEKYSENEYDYFFENKWYLASDETELYTFDEIQNIKNIAEDLIFVPIYTRSIKQCKIIVYDTDAQGNKTDQIIHSEENVDYGTNFKECPYYLPLYGSDKKEVGNSRYQLIGFKDGNTDQMYENLESIVAISTEHILYAMYQLVQNNKTVPTDARWFEIDEENGYNPDAYTCHLKLRKSRVKLEKTTPNKEWYLPWGTVVIPTEYTDSEGTRFIVTGIESFNQIEIGTNQDLIIGKAICNGSYITNVYFEDNAKVKRNQFVIGKECFAYLKDSLRYVELDYKELTEIQNDAFRTCANLSAQYIGSDDGLPLTIGMQAFRGVYRPSNDYAPTMLYIGGNVTKIGSGAFSYCERLTGMTIGTVKKGCSLLLDDNENIFKLREENPVNIDTKGIALVENFINEIGERHAPYLCGYKYDDILYTMGPIMRLGKNNDNTFTVIIETTLDKFEYYENNLKYLFCSFIERNKSSIYGTVLIDKIFIDGENLEANSAYYTEPFIQQINYSVQESEEVK